MENATMNKEPVTGDMLIANIIKKYPEHGLCQLPRFSDGIPHRGLRGTWPGR